MKVVIAGGTGLIGSSLKEALLERGDEVLILTRSTKKHVDSIGWNPENETIDLTKLEGAELVINLAGENIASKLWGEKQKKKIQESRIKSTRTLVSAFAKLKIPPKAFISASAIGYYGDRGEELLAESSSLGSGFLAETTDRWEREAKKAEALGIRTALCRFGIVLSPKGGALAKMLPIFKLGLGGKLGSGNQCMSWISLEDAISAVIFVAENARLAGAINIVSPSPVTNLQFTKALGTALRRPTFFAVPEIALKLVGGEMAKELFLASSRVTPKVLLESGFKFQESEITAALRNIE